MLPRLPASETRAALDPDLARARQRGSERIALPALLLLLAAVRGLLVVSLADVFLYGEELQKGAAAKALLDGLPLPWHALAFQPYEGGGFVVSHLDALAFLVCGQSLLALKLVAFGLDALILLVGWRFARWAFGARAALAFGLLHALAPASVQKQALLALGIHYEALPFTLGVLYLGARVAFEHDLRPRTLALLGLVAGFGIYFSYQVVLVVAFVGLLLALAERRALLGRSAVPGWIGFAVGLLPLVWMVAHVGSAVLDIHGQSLVGQAARGGQVARLAAFLGSVYADRAPLDLLELVLRPLAVVAGLALALRAVPASLARRCALLVGGYLAFFGVVYATSGFAVGEVYHPFLFHRLSPAWPLGALLIGAGVQQALGRRGFLRDATLATVVLLAAMGLRDTLAAASEGSPGSWRANLDLVARTKGYAYRGYLTKIAHELEGTPAEKLALAARFEEPDPVYLQRGAAHALFLDPALSLAQVRAAIASAGATDPTGYWLGLGPWLRVRLGGALDGRVRAVQGEPEAELLVEAIARFGSRSPPTLEDLEQDVRAGLEQGLPAAFFRGLGGLLYDVRGVRRGELYWQHAGPPFALDPRACEAFLALQDPAIEPLLREGYRRAVEEHTLR